MGRPEVQDKIKLQIKLSEELARYLKEKAKQMKLSPNLAAKEVLSEALRGEFEIWKK